MRVFPILDLLNSCSSLLAMVNPLNYFRWMKAFSKYLTGSHSQTMDPREVG